MNTALARPESLTQKLGSAVLSRLRLLVSTEPDHDTAADVTASPYSFQSECQCPDDCLRDHENE